MANPPLDSFRRIFTVALCGAICLFAVPVLEYLLFGAVAFAGDVIELFFLNAFFIGWVLAKCLETKAPRSGFEAVFMVMVTPFLAYLPLAVWSSVEIQKQFQDILLGEAFFLAFGAMVGRFLQTIRWRNMDRSKGWMQSHGEPTRI